MLNLIIKVDIFLPVFVVSLRKSSKTHKVTIMKSS